MKLSIVVPCYNEENTLERCIGKVLEIADDSLKLEIIIVDDSSKDRSLSIAQRLMSQHPEIRVFHHEKNKGKGAALRTGFREATGDFVAVQDADLEYDPRDLKRLLTLLIRGEADVVMGSRFLSTGSHRVLYFWHYLGNLFLTFISNMFTDLNLSDMETCYKVFRRDVIQSIEIEEDRFGFEPEIVAKIAALRLRVYEEGISYFGRTYAEGKKIGAKDGFRALYCIVRYNAHRAPLPIQFLFYLLIGGISAVFNLAVFLGMRQFNFDTSVAAPTAFILAAVLNYLLCISLIFRHRAYWNTAMEFLVYCVIVVALCVVDLGLTYAFVFLGFGAGWAKASASIVGLALNFIARRFFVFPEPSSGKWKPSTAHPHDEIVGRAGVAASASAQSSAKGESVRTAAAGK